MYNQVTTTHTVGIWWLLLLLVSPALTLQTLTVAVMVLMVHQINKLLHALANFILPHNHRVEEHQDVAVVITTTILSDKMVGRQ